MIDQPLRLGMLHIVTNSMRSDDSHTGAHGGYFIGDLIVPLRYDDEYSSEGADYTACVVYNAEDAYVEYNYRVMCDELEVLNKDLSTIADEIDLSRLDRYIDQLHDNAHYYLDTRGEHAWIMKNIEQTEKKLRSMHERLEG